MTFWGKTFALVTLPAAALAGTAKGTYNAVSGNGSFGDGFEETIDIMCNSAEEFGDKHADHINKTVIGMVGAVTANEIKKRRN